MSVVGRWRIANMELWDQDAVDLVAPGFIEFEAGSMGSFGFSRSPGQLGLATGSSRRAPGTRVLLKGFEENDPNSGRGWATLEDDGCLRGHLHFHLGDDSGFHVTRAVKAPRSSCMDVRLRGANASDGPAWSQDSEFRRAETAPRLGELPVSRVDPPP